eukprot:m51a1_g13907 putative group xv phospholipase a2-like (408) ;mRNA; f:761992-763377
MLFSRRNLVIATVVAALASAQSRRAPVVIVPGLSGSAIEGKDADKAKWDRYWASIQDEGFRLSWTLKRLMLDWDPTSNVYSNISGVDIRPIAFGTTDGIDYLDKTWFGTGVIGSDYMQTLIKTLEGYGYKRNYDIVGAPYDWRLPMSGLEQTGYFAALEALIEDLCQKTGEKVVVVAHCYGAVITSAWWSRPEADQGWKDKNLKALVTIATPWFGAGAAAEMVLSGSADSLELWGHPLLDTTLMRSWSRTIGSFPLLFPKSEFGDAGHVFVRTPARHYTLDQIDDLLIDAGANVSREQLAAIRARGDFELPKHPGVRVVCVAATGKNTTTAYTYADAVSPLDGRARPSDWEDGDGTVLTRSAKYCLRWREQRPDLRLDYSEWPGAGHLGIVKKVQFVEYLYGSVLTD